MSSGTTAKSDNLVVGEQKGSGRFVSPTEEDSRQNSVWVSTEHLVPLNETKAPLSDETYQALLTALRDFDELTILHEQDTFINEWNEVVDNTAWCRIRRYEKKIIDPKPETSLVYEESLAQLVENEKGIRLPMISTLAVQQQTAAAQQEAWVRVVGLCKYANCTFGLVQEYDGAGFVVAFRGAELQPQFFLQVLMNFSDAYWRESHDMWLEARYKLYRHSFATWNVETIEGIGPKAEAFYTNLKEALLRLGFPQLGPLLEEQLERIRKGKASGSGQVLVQETKDFVRGLTKVGT